MFEIGQLVTHRDQPMLAMITAFQRAGGRDFYQVRRLADDAPVPDLIILGEVLVAVADEDAEAVMAAELALAV